MVDPRRFVSLAAACLVALAAGCSPNSTVAPINTTPAQSVVVAPSVDTLEVGEARVFTATAYDSSAAIITGAPIQWQSSDPNIASVNASGRVRGEGEGAALIFATCGAARDTAAVFVVPTATGWFLQPAGSSGIDLHGVFFDAAGRNGWAVGENGRVLATDDAGVTWATQASGTAFTLNAVWFTSSSEGWIAGAAGTVLHTLNSGTTWTRMSTGTTDALNDITFAHRDTGWAVGVSGTILRTTDRGAHWTRTSVTAFTLRGVAFAGTRDGWAVGDGGTILGTHDRGLTWFTVLPAVTANALRSVARRSASLAWAVGDQGVAPRTSAGPDSVVWTLDNAGASLALEGVHFPTATTGWAVGTNGSGVAARSDDGGDTWTTQTAGTPFTLHDVFFVNDRQGWAVGDNGTIIHTATGGRP